MAFSVVSGFCKSFGSFRSENENDDEYDFFCFVSVRMRIYPRHVTNVRNPFRPFVNNEILRVSGLHEIEKSSSSSVPSIYSIATRLFSLKTGKKNQRKKNTKMAVFSLKYHTAVHVVFVIFDSKN